MAYYASNYPSNSGPPPPSNPFAMGAYGASMAAGAYNNYGGQSGGYQQQQAYGGYNQQRGNQGYMATAAPPAPAPVYNVPAYTGPQAGAAPECPPPPPSILYSNMQNSMAEQGMVQMQMKLLNQMNLIEDDEEEYVQKRRKQGMERRRKTFIENGFDGAGDEDDEEAFLQQQRDEKKSRMEERIQQAEEKARLLQEQLGNNESLKEELREKFIDELMRRQDFSGTFEETQGTVFPCLKYEEGDPVAVWYNTKRKEGTMSIVGEAWDPAYDAECLYNGMKGIGTNEKIIIDVVASRSAAQRYSMKKEYKTAYGKDLIKDLRSELSGDFKSSILASFESPARYDAWCIKKAIYGAGTDERALIEILMTRTNAQIEEMTSEYNKITYDTQKDPESSLEKDIIDDTSGDFKRLMISAAQGNRRLIPREKLEQAVEEVLHNDIFCGMFRVNYENLVNMQRCKMAAEELYKAGEKKIGTDEDTFNRIFSTMDYYSLRVVWDEYVKITQRDILNSVDRETSGDFKHALRAVAQNIKCRPMFFAERLYRSMKGAGTDDTTLIRIVFSRSEIDLVQIKRCFLESYKQTLWNFIHDDTSGDYRRILEAIVGRD